MILQTLDILNYKNIAQAELSFSPKINCFVGVNGMGKTNLLDAIYYLSFCHSASTTIDAHVIRHDSEFFTLQGIYLTDEGETENVYCGLKRGCKKQFKRNKKEYRRLAEHIGRIPLVMISPADGALIAGGSDERRRFMDVVISQYDSTYLEALVRYNKALTQRNALLKMEGGCDENVLAVYEEMMAAEGTTIFTKRTTFIERFIPIVRNIYSQISGQREQVELRYISHGQRGDLLSVIRNDRAKDLVVGYSLHGIHKDEIEMSLEGYALKREGSQGQNKTFLIAMKLAQFEFLKQSGCRATPILLLDDIFDKLDAGRVEEIIKMVAGNRFGQIFITDTNREHLDRILERTGPEHHIFRVDQGHIEA